MNKDLLCHAAIVPLVGLAGCQSTEPLHRETSKCMGMPYTHRDRAHLARPRSFGSVKDIIHNLIRADPEMESHLYREAGTFALLHEMEAG